MNGQVSDFLHLQNESENDMSAVAHRANLKRSMSQH